MQILTGAMHGMGLIDVVQKYEGIKYVYLYDYKANYSGQFIVGTYGKYLGKYSWQYSQVERKRTRYWPVTVVDPESHLGRRNSECIRTEQFHPPSLFWIII